MRKKPYGRRVAFGTDSTIIHCRDGKHRPIPTEPALFPLANGLSNRVGILRGTGNAIVPQAAAEIIKAFMETYIKLE
jgi:DNA (cytosine-5)-methyltransferase 1